MGLPELPPFVRHHIPVWQARVSMRRGKGPGAPIEGKRLFEGLVGPPDFMAFWAGHQHRVPCPELGKQLNYSKVLNHSRSDVQDPSSPSAAEPFDAAPAIPARNMT